MGNPSTQIRAVKRAIRIDKLTDNELFLTALMGGIKVGAIQNLHRLQGTKRVHAYRAVLYSADVKGIINQYGEVNVDKYQLIIVEPRKGWDGRHTTTSKFNYYLDCRLHALSRFYDIGGDLTVAEVVEYSYKKCRRPR